jgi:hypothetical protein
MEGGWGLVWNSSFVSMISHTTFDNMDGHQWTNELLITRRVIKVIALYICFCVSCLISSSIYNYVPYILSLYVWHVNFCYGMSHCLCSELVKLIVVVHAQHINNRKYSNSYTINDKCRQPIVCIGFAL